MSERCETTDLLIDQCACDKHRGGAYPVRTEPAVLLATWFARYPGKCSDCGGKIHVGERMGRDQDGSYLCKSCV